MIAFAGISSYPVRRGKRLLLLGPHDVNDLAGLSPFLGQSVGISPPGRKRRTIAQGKARLAFANPFDEPGSGGPPGLKGEPGSKVSATTLR